VIRVLPGTPVSIAITTRYYVFRETVKVDASFPIVSFPAGQLGVVVVTAPSGSDVTTQPSDVAARSLAGNGIVLRLVPGPAQITVTKGSQSKTESVTVEAGKDLAVTIDLPEDRPDPKQAPKRDAKEDGKKDPGGDPEIDVPPATQPKGAPTIQGEKPEARDPKKEASQPTDAKAPPGKN